MKRKEKQRQVLAVQTFPLAMLDDRLVKTQQGLPLCKAASSNEDASTEG
jgi:hypothetical protein